jgi:DNA-binding IclR family transcriptional regulator
MPKLEAAHVSRTFEAMEVLAAAEDGLSAPMLGEAIGVHCRTARRILRRMEGDGYVTVSRDQRRRYRPTMRAVALAGLIVERATVPRVAVSHVKALHERLGVSAHLCVSSHMYALCLVHAADGPCASRPQLRELVPVHCTASGKALLTWRRAAWRDAVLSQPLGRYTDRTLTEPGMVRRDLRFTKARGFAYEDREYQATARGFAAPVRGEGGEVLAALSVVAPVERFAAEEVRNVGMEVMDAAAGLSLELGYEPSASGDGVPVTT